MSAFVIATLVAGSRMREGVFRKYTVATLAVVVVFGALSGYFAAPMPGPTPWLGLVERVNIYAWMSWMAAPAAVCWPTAC